VSEPEDDRIVIDPENLDDPGGVAAEPEPEASAAPGGNAGDEVTQLRAELQAEHERFLRTLADFENYKRRIDRERAERERYAAFAPLQELLMVVDNLDLAASAEGSAEDLRQGVEMILRQLRKLLERFGVETIAAVGEPFDPSVHEAIARLEDPEVSEPVVAEELQKGYRMGDRLMRAAMVKVAVPPEGRAAD